MNDPKLGQILARYSGIKIPDPKNLNDAKQALEDVRELLNVQAGLQVHLLKYVSAYQMNYMLHTMIREYGVTPNDELLAEIEKNAVVIHEMHEKLRQQGHDGLVSAAIQDSSARMLAAAMRGDDEAKANLKIINDAVRKAHDQKNG